MPYQEGYLPEYTYSGNYANGQARPYNQQNGQLQQPGSGYSHQMQQRYQQPSLQPHTPYVTAQYPSQGPAQYAPAQYQQPYLSPPSQHTSTPQNPQYSPDPLHRYHPPPQPRQTPNQYQQQQQPPPTQGQRPVSQSSRTPQAPRPQSSQRHPAASPQWPQFPSSPSPYEAQGQMDARSAAHTSYVTQQTHQPQQIRQQSSHVQRELSQASQLQFPSPEELRRASPAQNQQQARARPSQQAILSQDYKGSQSSSQQAGSVNAARNLNQRPGQSDYSQLAQYSGAGQIARAMTAHQPAVRAVSTSGPAPHSKPGPKCSTTNSSILQAQAPVLQASSQRPEIKVLELPQVRSPKRRKSNDGTSVAICRPPVPQPSQPQIHHIKQEPGLQQDQSTKIKHPPATVSSPLTALASSQMPPNPTPATTIDYQSVLLVLSDDYISAAYSLTGSLSISEVSEELLDQYQSLLSTGLGCLDSVLKNYRFSDPRQEARIRLRYASLLYEETENLTDAEECLSKGISLCERARLTDLKYAMHHLIARIWFKSCKFKTAMKTVERLAAEVEKLQLLHWVYAFHFLRVSFGLQIPNAHHEAVSLVRYLNALSAVATRHYHVSVQILAYTLEALVHLRARTPDSVDLANRAMASARMHQLTPEMSAMPHIRALLDFTDVACSMIRFDRKQTDAKLQAMQAQLDQSARDVAWADSDGCTLSINLGHDRGVDVDADSGGIFQKASNGDISLTFSWLTKQQTYAVGYLISGLTKLDGRSGHEAAKFLNHVLTLSRNEPKSMPLSQSAATERWQMQLKLRATARLYVAFAFCGVSDWANATNALRSYRDLDLPQLEGVPETACTTIALYLDALIKHGLGELEDALKLYRAPALQVKPSGGTKGDTVPVDPIKVLAALNSVEILHLHGKHKDAELLLNWSEQYCIVTRNSDGGEHGSRAMEALFYMLKAIASQRADGLIIDTKSILQRSVKAAQNIGNNQLLMIVMNIMTDAWFKNIVGQQARSSGKSARDLAGRNNNRFWKAIGTRMYADTLELTGQLAEAEEMRQDAQQLMASLPPALRDAFQDGRTN